MKILQKKWVFILSFWLLIVGCSPSGATDPNDPAFNINEFQMKNYEDVESLQKALEILLPEGTSKTEVDKLLVDIAGAYNTLPFHLGEPTEYSKTGIWTPEKGPDGYIIGYNAPDKEWQEPEYLSAPSWEVYAYFNLGDELKRVEVKRYEWRLSMIQKHFLRFNPNNETRQKRE